MATLFDLVLAVLHAIFKSELFWFVVAGTIISWWISWVVRDAVKAAIREIDFDERIRDAVRDALGEKDDD
jgi:hypothetical protein